MRPIRGIVGSSDVAGLERIAIKLYMMPVLWDVLSVATYALLRYYIGPEHAWPVAAMLCAVCAVDRDLTIHELVSVVYMLRYSCSTDSIAGSAAYSASAVVCMVSFCAYTKWYTGQGHMFRRSCLFCTTILGVMVRYPWNTGASESVGRLVAYTFFTRIAVGGRGLDPWDAAVQCVWLLAAPLYTYLALLYPVALHARQRAWPLNNQRAGFYDLV